MSSCLPSPKTNKQTTKKTGKRGRPPLPITVIFWRVGRGRLYTALVSPCSDCLERLLWVGYTQYWFALDYCLGYRSQDSTPSASQFKACVISTFLWIFSQNCADNTRRNYASVAFLEAVVRPPRKLSVCSQSHTPVNNQKYPYMMTCLMNQN